MIMNEENQNDFEGAVTLSVAEGRMLMPIGERDALDASVEEEASKIFAYNDDFGVRMNLPVNSEPRLEEVMTSNNMTRDTLRNRTFIPIAQEVYTSDEYQHLDDSQKKKLIRKRCAANGITNSKAYSSPDDPNFDGAAAYDEDVAYAISKGIEVSRNGLQKGAVDFGKMMKSNPSLWMKNQELQDIQNEWNDKFARGIYKKTGADKLDFVKDTEGSINFIMERERDNFTAYRANEMYTAWMNSMTEEERKKITFAQDALKKKEFISKAFKEALDVISRNPDSFGLAYETQKIESAQAAARLYQQKAQAAKKAMRELQEAGEVDKKTAEKESISTKAKESLEKKEAQSQAALAAAQENIPAVLNIQSANLQLSAINEAAKARAMQDNPDAVELIERSKAAEKQITEEAKGKFKVDKERIQFKHGSNTAMVCGVMKNFANEKDEKGKPVPVLGVPQDVYDKMVKDLSAENDGFYVVYGRGKNAVRLQVRVAKGVARPCLNKAAANAIYQPRRGEPLTSEQKAIRKAGYRNSFTFIKNPSKTSTKK